VTTTATPRPLAEIAGSEDAIRLVEGADGLKKLMGNVAKVDVVNRNNRYYSRAVFEKAVGKVQPLIANGELTGELDHPEGSVYGTLENTAFIFDRLYVEDDLVKFEARILNTPAGKTLEGLLEGGVRVGMSTRGTGSIKWSTPNEGKDGTPPVAHIQEDYVLAGVDAVKVPSNESGFARLRESVEARMTQARQEREEITVEINTVEELRTQFPTLIQSVEESARSEAEQARAVAEAKVTELEGQLTSANEQIVEIQASLAEATKAKEQLATLRSALLGESHEGHDSDVTTAVAALREQVENLRAELDEAEAERESLERHQALKDALDVALAKTEFANALREAIDPIAFDSVDALNAEVARLEKVAKQVAGPGGSAKGKGQPHMTTEHTTPTNSNPWITERSLKIAGAKVEG
jgi:hypothetical protein